MVKQNKKVNEENKKPTRKTKIEKQQEVAAKKPARKRAAKKDVLAEPEVNIDQVVAQVPQGDWVKDLQKDQWTSMTNYLKVDNVNGASISVSTPHGENYVANTGYLEGMDNCACYNKIEEVTKTAMVEKLQAAKDKVFTVVFRKKINPEDAAQSFTKYTQADFADNAKMKELANSILNGDLCTITGRLGKDRPKVGRSMVIDLNADAKYNIRLVDHRTIECLIIENIKYVVKGSKVLHPEVGIKYEDGQQRPIRVGDWFSRTIYMQFSRKVGTQFEFINNGQTFSICDGYVKSVMTSAHSFATTTKVNRTELLEVFNNVRDRVFTVVFNKKPTDKFVQDSLKDVDYSQVNTLASAKRFAMLLIEGEECEITGHLRSSENDLGRSLVIDLKADKNHAFKQVDHRTIKSLIFENVKYEVK